MIAPGGYHSSLFRCPRNPTSVHAPKTIGFPCWSWGHSDFMQYIYIYSDYSVQQYIVYMRWILDSVQCTCIQYKCTCTMYMYDRHPHTYTCTQRMLTCMCTYILH